MDESEDLSEFDKGQIVMARQLGQSISQTAELVGCSQSAVVSIYKKWSKDGQPLNRRQGHRHPGAIQARGVARLGRSHRKTAVTQIADNLDAAPDDQQSENMLLHSMLTPAHRQERLHWARERQDWTMEQWKKVAWSGESRFLLHHVDGRVHVLRLPGEEMAEECSMERSQASRGSVTLWAIFCWETSGACIHVDAPLSGTTYLNIVADHVHPFMTAVFPDGSGLFQQDNAPCHSAELVREWFEEHDQEFQVLSWPPKSPDLNPIEHLWDFLEKQAQSMETLPHNLQDFRDMLLTSWCQVPEDIFRGFVESMPQRVRAVLAEQGGPIQY